MQRIFLPLLISLILLSSPIIAQKLDSLSGWDILMEAIELEAEGYEEALEKLDLINPNDTVFILSEFQRALYNYNLGNYEAVTEITSRNLGKATKDIPSWYINASNAYAQLDKYTEAMEMNALGREHFVVNAELEFYRGNLFSRQENYQEAYKCYQKAIELNPFNSLAHQQIGLIALQSGNYTAAFMALNMKLLTGNGGQSDLNLLIELNNLAESTPKMEDPLDVNIFSSKKSPFREIDLVVEGQVALDKKYKADTKLDFPLIKQLHVICANLKLVKGDESIFGSFYVPFYKEMMKEGHFDAMAHNAMRSTDIEKLQKEIKSKSSDIKEFAVWAYQEITDSYNKMEYAIDGVTKEYDVIRLDGGQINFLGEIKGEKSVGPCIYFYDDGQVETTGSFNDKGEKIGEWTIRYEDGTPKEVDQYSNGKLKGEVLVYNPNGTLENRFTLSDSKLDGPAEYYNHRGIIQTKAVFKEGSVDPDYPVENFYQNGGMKNKKFLKEGAAKGPYEAWFADGKKQYEYMLEKDMIEGPYKEWHINGQLAEEANYKGGVLHGPFKSYYSNGQVHKEGEYSEGQSIGLHKAYHMNGKIYRENEFDESGKENGVSKEYSWGGKLLEETEYRKGEIIGYTAYNTEGEVIVNKRKKSGEFLYEGYYIDGTKSMEGIYKVGKQSHDGEWKYYDRNGNLRKVAQYQDGKYHGMVTNYFTLGGIDDRLNWINDKRHGLFESFYETTGELYCQGWYKKDQQWGEWNYYYLDGTNSKTYFFVDGELHGDQYYYAVDGKLNFIETYDKGVLTGLKYYNQEGELTQNAEIGLGSQVFDRVDADGNLISRYSFMNHIMQGDWNRYYADGRERSVGKQINGDYHGPYTYYYPNGKVSMQGDYVLGYREGNWKWYYDNGNMSSETGYVYGEKHGVDFNYSEEGDTTSIFNYFRNETDGEVKFYDPEGKYQMSRFYENGKWVAYGYLGEDGKPIPPISIQDETSDVKAYYTNGNLAREFSMKNGKFTGEYKKFYKDGSLYSLSNYKDGVEMGTEKEYYKDGSIKEENTYEYGRIVKKIAYHPNGKIKEEVNYLNGELHGSKRKYDIKGKILADYNYYNGVLQ